MKSSGSFALSCVDSQRETIARPRIIGGGEFEQIAVQLGEQLRDVALAERQIGRKDRRDRRRRDVRAVAGINCISPRAPAGDTASAMKRLSMRANASTSEGSMR